MNFDTEIDVAQLDEHEQRELLRYYQKSLRALDGKLKVIQDGRHTIMSQHGIELLDQMRQAYWRRIQALQGALDPPTIRRD